MKPSIDEFDKTLTDAERKADNFLDWSNETLGRCVRHTAKLIKDFQGKDALYIQSAFMVIANEMRQSNAEKLNSTVLGETEGENWKLEIKAKLTRKE